MGLTAGIGVAAVVGACRQAGPDELVYTGARSQSGTSGRGGSSVATGGSSSGGSTSGTSGSNSQGGDAGAGGETSTGGRDEPRGGRGGTSGDTGGTGAAGAGGDAGGSTTEPDCEPVPVGSGAFTKRALLEAAGACAMREYCLFEFHADVLRERAATAASEGTDEAVLAAREAWLSAMGTWEVAELFQFGPAASSNVGGAQGLRELIYSWPLSVRCKVDEQTVSRFYEKAAFFGDSNASPTSGRTLHALEYLLFYGGTDNGCTSFSTINSRGTWAELSAAELRKRKLDYAARAAEDVATRAEALVSAWNPDGGDYRTKLVNVQPLFASEQAALNVVAHALFYVDTAVKDQKLGVPAGLHMDCPSTSCPNNVEAPFARTSVEHIAQNLRGFRKLFQGCADGNAGVGFDDWLHAAGAHDLAGRMLAALDAAEAAVTAMDAPLEELVVSDPGRVRAVHAAIKGVTDLLKGEFITVLNIEPPGGPGQVDND